MRMIESVGGSLSFIEFHSSMRFDQFQQQAFDFILYGFFWGDHVRDEAPCALRDGQEVIKCCFTFQIFVSAWTMAPWSKKMREVS